MTSIEAKDRFTATLNAMNVAAFLYKITVTEHEADSGTVSATNAAKACITAHYSNNKFTEWDLFVPGDGKERNE